ncbi:MAG TPA: hypothetical protein VMZ28_00200 [Kofleriaceae bacterium]|nr:hypothetical protein [Kofleriaceae bacterium]
MSSRRRLGLVMAIAASLLARRAAAQVGDEATLKLTPEGPDVAADIGLGRYGDALDRTARAIAERPRDARAWHLRGRVLAHVLRPGDAADAFARAAELDPEWSVPAADHVFMLWTTGRDEDAAEALARARRKWPRGAREVERMTSVLAIDSKMRNDRVRDFAADSAAAAVQDAMSQLMAGRYTEVLLNRVDRPRLLEILGVRDEANLRAEIDDLVGDIAREVADDVYLHCVEYLVSDVVEVAGDHARVGVNAMCVVHASQGALERLRRDAAGFLAPLVSFNTTLNLLSSIPAAERERTLAALARPFFVMAPIHVELVRRGAVWMLDDILYRGTDRVSDGLRAWRGATQEPPAAAAPAQPARLPRVARRRVAPEEEDDDSTVVWMLGLLAGAALIMTGLVLVARRLS